MHGTNKHERHCLLGQLYRQNELVMLKCSIADDTSVIQRPCKTYFNNSLLSTHTSTCYYIISCSFMVSTSESMICACWGYIGFSTDNKIGLPAAYFVEVQNG
jgi:hypothetical protein